MFQETSLMKRDNNKSIIDTKFHIKMKIYKKYSAIIEWFLAIILILICSKIIFPGSFTPLKAHEQSEKSVYYGPSNIIKTID